MLRVSRPHIGHRTFDNTQRACEQMCKIHAHARMLNLGVRKGRFTCFAVCATPNTNTSPKLCPR